MTHQDPSAETPLIERQPTAPTWATVFLAFVEGAKAVRVEPAISDTEIMVAAEAHVTVKSFSPM